MKNQTINTNPIDCNIEQCAKMMISGIDHHTNGATVNVNLYNGKLNYIFHLLRFFLCFIELIQIHHNKSVLSF